MSKDFNNDILLRYSESADFNNKPPKVVYPQIQKMNSQISDQSEFKLHKLQKPPKLRKLPENYVSSNQTIPNETGVLKKRKPQ